MKNILLAALVASFAATAIANEEVKKDEKTTEQEAPAQEEQKEAK